MEKISVKREERFSSERMYAHQLITIADLKEFKKQLIEELLFALKPPANQSQKKWLKSHEVRRLLKISPGTLQTLKSNGVIPYTKVGGVHSGGFGISNNSFYCTLNPFEKYIEQVDKNKRSYHALLKEKDEKIALLEKMLEKK